MIFLYAIAVGAVVAGGVYMMLERHVVRVILGIAMIAAAANMLIFLSGRVGTVTPPVIPYGGERLAEDAANPLPQALVLTAIVIGFALVSFTIVLAYRAWRTLGTLDTDRMVAAENEGTPFEPLPAPEDRGDAGATAAADPTPTAPIAGAAGETAPATVGDREGARPLEEAR